MPISQCALIVINSEAAFWIIVGLFGAIIFQMVMQRVMR